MNVVVLLTLLIIITVSSSLFSNADTPPPPSRIHLRILPLGDSISLCCHHCGVAPVILPRRYRTSNAEPNRPWEGYIKQLYRLLEHQGFSSPTSSYTIPTTMPTGQEGSGNGSRMQGSFSFEGRVRTCMMNNTPPSQGRVDTTDWSVRYEAYYGITSGGLLRDKLYGALREYYYGGDNVLDSSTTTSSTTAPPPPGISSSGGKVLTMNVILLHIGTNDLIQPKLTNRVNGAVSNVREMLGRIRSATATSSPGGGVVNVVIISRLSPMQFYLIGGDRLAPALSKKAHRWRDYNTALTDMVEQQEGYVPLNESMDNILHMASSSSSSGLKIMMVDPNTADSTPPSSTPCGAGSAEVEEGRASRPFELPPLDPRKHLHGDGLHLNPRGERVLATTYYSGIQRLLRSISSLHPADKKEYQLAPQFHIELNCERGPLQSTQKQQSAALVDQSHPHSSEVIPPLQTKDVVVGSHHNPMDERGDTSHLSSLLIPSPSSSSSDITTAIILLAIITLAAVVYLLIGRRRRYVMGRRVVGVNAPTPLKR